MQVTDFCTQMENELISWKAKLYDAIQTAEKLGAADKQKMTPDMVALHKLVEEIGQRVETLKTECPSDWSPIKKEIEQKSADLHEKYKKMEIYVGMIP